MEDDTNSMNDEFSLPLISKERNAQYSNGNTKAFHLMGITEDDLKTAHIVMKEINGTSPPNVLQRPPAEAARTSQSFRPPPKASRPSSSLGMRLSPNKKQRFEKNTATNQGGDCNDESKNKSQKKFWIMVLVYLFQIFHWIIFKFLWKMIQFVFSCMKALSEQPQLQSENKNQRNPSGENTALTAKKRPLPLPTTRPSAAARRRLFFSASSAAGEKRCHEKTKNNSNKRRKEEKMMIDKEEEGAEASRLDHLHHTTNDNPYNHKLNHHHSLVRSGTIDKMESLTGHSVEGLACVLGTKEDIIEEENRKSLGCLGNNDHLKKNESDDGLSMRLPTTTTTTTTTTTNNNNYNNSNNSNNHSTWKVKLPMILKPTKKLIKKARKSLMKSIKPKHDY